MVVAIDPSFKDEYKNMIYKAIESWQRETNLIFKFVEYWPDEPIEDEYVIHILQATKGEYASSIGMPTQPYLGKRALYI